MSSFESVSSSTTSIIARSPPMQIPVSAFRAIPAEPLAVISTTTRQRRDSQSSSCFTFSSATQRRKHSIARPSAYVSDADLWGLDEVPFLEEAPAPPRTAQQWLAQHNVPVVEYMRRSSTPSKQQRPVSKSNKT